MRINVYRIKAWKGKRLVYTLNYEFKDKRYEEIKMLLKAASYRLEEGIAWSWWK